MLSLLIPVYECDVRQLVFALHEQGQALGVPYEIRCYDDGSSEAIRELNREVSNLPEVVYQEMHANLGRSGIRNRLATEARHPYLLFIDGDAGVVDDQFLQRYLRVAKPSTVFVGGTAYRPEPPDDIRHLLRWTYGKQREQRTASQRNLDSLLGFSTFNFLIPSEVFQQVRFDERMKGYGHEDTLFGWELRQRGFPIQHIDNPLYHLGLDTGAIFLEKTRQGLENLYRLQTLCPGVDTKLLKTLRLVRHMGLARPFGGLLRLLRPWMEAQLLGTKPSIRVLDWYKLGWGLERAKDS
jgi:glycosyltransferase involved in cell wall biosynthesis